MKYIFTAFAHPVWISNHSGKPEILKFKRRNEDEKICMFRMWLCL